MLWVELKVKLRVITRARTKSARSAEAASAHRTGGRSAARADRSCRSQRPKRPSEEPENGQVKPSIDPPEGVGDCLVRASTRPARKRESERPKAAMAGVPGECHLRPAYPSLGSWSGASCGARIMHKDGGLSIAFWTPARLSSATSRSPA